jgi:type II secretory pathway pseudopilin PulG
MNDRQPVRYVTRDRCQGGFTIVDMAITLALLALVAAITVSAVVKTMETYRRSLAARHVLVDIRRVQSLAVSRGGIFGLQWGGDNGVNLSPGYYRIARDTTGSCEFPAVGAPIDGSDVVRGWYHLPDDYLGIRIQSVVDANDRALSGVMFNPLGASVNTCESASFPVTLTLVDRSGGTETIEIRKSGVARLI